MLGAWRRQWLARREAAALRRRAIADDLWKRTLVRYPFLHRRDPADAAELRRLTSLFLDRKEFSAAGGLQLTDAMAVAIAAQAVLPVLRLGLARYDGFVGIVVHPDQVVARREVADEDGVVHDYDEVLAGEAMEGGPVMLSWRDVRSAGRNAGHGLQRRDPRVRPCAGHAPTAPPTACPCCRPTCPRPSGARRSTPNSTRFAALVDAGPETALDPYGAQSEDEFFAVASEAFFVSPAAMQREHPALYALFARFYRQDPVAELPPPRRRA